jgi:predicted transcriptional regulator
MRAGSLSATSDAELIDQSSIEHEPGQRNDYSSIIMRLGKCTDLSLAAELGVHRSLVGRLRRELRIPKYDRVARVVHLLGKISDRELARRSGIASATIAKHRRDRGIMPHKQSKSRARMAIQAYVDQLTKTLES